MPLPMFGGPGEHEAGRPQRPERPERPATPAPAADGQNEDEELLNMRGSPAPDGRPSLTLREARTLHRNLMAKMTEVFMLASLQQRAAAGAAGQHRNLTEFTPSGNVFSGLPAPPAPRDPSPQALIRWANRTMARQRARGCEDELSIVPTSEPAITITGPMMPNMRRTRFTVQPHMGGIEVDTEWTIEEPQEPQEPHGPTM